MRHSLKAVSRLIGILLVGARSAAVLDDCWALCIARIISRSTCGVRYAALKLKRVHGA